MRMQGAQSVHNCPVSDERNDEAPRGRILTNCPPGEEYVVEWAMDRDELDDADDRRTHRILEGD